ncbi:peptidase associated/transthyretin-like domain-containing protein [Flavobacterium degerlachei]|uniref:PEGA domain-containing protein n=1 Tax=Flavobacterium degerlachei TaxID=229203 RepID=A0A1H2UHS4_9FLAO|nr:hypothetical protein [Flavobacterium degerlachei]SDW55478.1 hypothetical protein SAMN05444338_103170 [Flavobacterium degerlachei]
MKLKLNLVAVLSIILLSSCASIVSKSSWPITINSTPSEAKISIKDKKGIEIYTGNTPATLKLKSGAGFFSKAQYQVTFEKVGFDKKVVPVEFKLNGWYFGNILFGGPLGLLIIDPATGAMFKLETEFLNETLTKSVTSVETRELKLLDINKIPTEWRNHLILVSK